jgi:hypothetical protein
MQRFRFGRLDISQDYDSQGKANTIYYISRNPGDIISWDGPRFSFTAMVWAISVPARGPLSVMTVGVALFGLRLIAVDSL